jgi:probable phosphoglycerate mutase
MTKRPIKKLLLIRHGSPHENHATHPADPPLDAAGHRHARRLAKALANENIDRIVCSPQRRALDTAAPLAELLGIGLEIVDGVAEVDRHVTGRYRSAETIRREEPQRWAEFSRSPARFLGRDPDEYRATVLSAFNELIDSDRGTHVAVVSHGMTINTVLRAVVGAPGERNGLFAIGHCSVTRLSGNSLFRMRVDSVNESVCRPVRARAARMAS